MDTKLLLELIDTEINGLLGITEEKELAPINEENKLAADKGKILDLFKLQISENWGKLDTVERQEFVAGRLMKIEEQMTQLREGTLGKIKNPRRILSQIILLETFNRLFKGFQPSPAGFINEGLLSVFYGSTQEEAGEANKAFQIGDVIAADGSPISVKTKIDGKAIVDGSIKNLYHSLNGSSTGKVYFDIFLKKATAKGEKEVGSLTYIRFVVDASNINDFLGKDFFDPDPEDPTKVVLKPEYSDTHLSSKAVNEGIASTKYGSKAIRDYFQQQAAKEAEGAEPVGSLDIGAESLANLFGVKSADQLAQFLSGLLSSKEFTRGAIGEEGEREIYNGYVQDIAKLSQEINRGKKKIQHDPKTGKIETEFKLEQGAWENFAMAQGNMVQEPIVLNFSEADIAKTIEVAVEQIDEAITDMFNSLAVFTETVQTYLTTIASNRGSIGIKATEEANKLPEKTEKVVAVAAADPDEEGV